MHILRLLLSPILLPTPASTILKSLTAPTNKGSATEARRVCHSSSPTLSGAYHKPAFSRFIATRRADTHRPQQSYPWSTGNRNSSARRSFTCGQFNYCSNDLHSLSEHHSDQPSDISHISHQQCLQPAASKPQSSSRCSQPSQSSTSHKRLATLTLHPFTRER